MTATTHDILSYAWANRGGWRVYGDQITAGDGGPVPTLEEIESHRADAEAALAIAAAQRLARSTARASLAEQWTTLPAWIRGPFGATYTAAVVLLDQADDAAAAALIEYAEPPSGYSLEQVQAFNLIRAELLASIESLPAL
jgi:hypothetical protein